METQEDLQRGEQFETQWLSHKDDARDAFIDEAIQILMPIQHHVDEIDCEVHINNVPAVADAILKVSNLRFFDFSVEIEGRAMVYEETFSYDFTLECIDLLNDELGYTSSHLLT